MEHIDTKLINVVKQILGIDYVARFNLEQELDDQILHIILSDSLQALHFVTLIEEEFKIEFDDDDINLDFFSNFKSIKNLLIKHAVES